MKSNIIKRGVAGLLSLVMCISTFVELAVKNGKLFGKNIIDFE